jgi:DnaJ-class molecular chaperone
LGFVLFSVGAARTDAAHHDCAEHASVTVAAAKETCATCWGTGKMYIQSCNLCSGTGKIITGGLIKKEKQCKTCKGNGKIPQKCATCKGKGKI